ncbi:hypothetical protein [Corynebacterium sp. MSK039]|uniref:hypothetical protein n=1 Tax=Corynebacterium sp. MSK039 TaxID=3050193 RepID=UPI002550293D|nr:hypothetical protein [Corynebacterium sp. MSK039]MDK8791824.1 hypothetical protein [Corynebacterium sp. MSK039]
MKRFPRTLTAAVMAGALAVGGATVAQAQIPAPAELTVEGVKYQKQANGEYKPVEGFVGEPGPNLTEKQAQEIWEQQQAENEDPEAPAPGEDTPGEDTPGEDTPGENGEAPEAQKIPLDVTKDGNRYEYNGDGLYVNENDPSDTLTVEEALEIWKKQQEGDKDGDKKKLAWLALPAALIIGGIVYHLMKDGQTYTPDEGRKNEDPTAEEKAASDKLLGENKDEVIAQGGQLAEGADAAATDRGIAAETGSNAAARGLAALAVVAMVAAGAFAASRKLFA